MGERRRGGWNSMKNYHQRDYGQRYASETEALKKRFESEELTQKQYDDAKHEIDKKYGWL